MSDHILLRTDGPVATVVLNRPQRLNAFNMPMAERFWEIFRKLAADHRIRLVQLRGSGRAFSAGGDIKEIQKATDLAAYYWDVSQALHEAVLLIRRMSQPVLAVCNGPVSGVAFGIATACDMRIASSDATFHAGTTRLGLAPNGGLTYFLPRLVGRGLAEQLILTGEKISGEDAFKCGLVNRVVAPEKLDEEVDAVTETLLKRAPLSQEKFKWLLRSDDRDLAEHLDREQDAISESAVTFDFREGTQAFLEKREPRFRGQ